MGAKTGLLVYADDDVPGLLRQVGAADLEQTSVMMRRLNPSCEIEETDGSDLYEGVYPPDGTAYAASWPGVEIICDQRVMIDSPSQLPGISSRRAPADGWSCTPCTAWSTGWRSLYGRTDVSFGL